MPRAASRGSADPHAHADRDVIGHFRIAEVGSLTGDVPSLFRLADTDDRGRPYNSLLISIMSAMGLDPADWESSPGAGLSNYDDNECNGYSQANGRLPLPHLTA